VLMQKFRRSCDVGEHERYGAAWEVFSHAELIIEPERVSRLVRDSVRDAFYGLESDQSAAWTDQISRSRIRTSVSS